SGSRTRSRRSPPPSPATRARRRGDPAGPSHRQRRARGAARVECRAVAEPTRDPDALLARAQREEARAGKGRLHIWFGAAPGVGKTYAMLAAAQRLAAEGQDVILGLIETHGRPETQALLRGLPQLPRRTVDYRGHELHEFDLDQA